MENPIFMKIQSLNLTSSKSEQIDLQKLMLFEHSNGAAGKELLRSDLIKMGLFIDSNLSAKMFIDKIGLLLCHSHIELRLS